MTATATATNAPTGAERRIHARRQPALGTIFRLKSETKDKVRIGLVWNISSGGVSLLVSEPIEPGTPVSGELTTTSDEPRLPCSVHITHLSKLQTGDYCVGARFDRSLTEVEMKPFLVESGAVVL